MKKAAVISVILFLLIPIMSCNWITDTTEITNKGKNKNNLSSFREFWPEFRQALIDKDSSKIIALTSDNLEVGRLDDSDRVIVFTGIDVASVVLFEYENGGYYDHFKDADVSNSEMILLPIENLWGYNSEDLVDQRINNFEFEKTTDGWKLVRLYTQVDNFLLNQKRR